MAKNKKKLRYDFNDTSVSSHAKTSVYEGFFSVEEHDLSYSKFDGTQSKVVTRGAIVSSEAVIVLPYDPSNDRILLVEQFRTGPYVRGDKSPWVLEPIAGLIESNETPEEAGLRETEEEACLQLKHLELVAQSYPSPGISTEFFHQYIGIASLPETTDLISGLKSESEDIRSHIFCFTEFLEMVNKGKINVGPAILLGLWLSNNRERLKALYHN